MQTNPNFHMHRDERTGNIVIITVLAMVALASALSYVSFRTPTFDRDAAVTITGTIR